MDITNILTENLSSKDFEMREEGLHDLCNLIINDKVTTEGKLLILDYSLKVLFVDVGLEKNNYVRSTNLSLIQCILEDNYEKQYIQDEKLDDVYSVMLEYTAMENVEFGYSKEFGMIHTLAYIADIFVTFFMYKRYCTHDRFKVYFELITSKYCSADYVFVTDEAARIFRIFNYYFINSSNVEYVIEYLEEYKKVFKKDLSGLYQKQNYYNYLHTLNFFTNDMELLRFINSQLETKYKRYIYEVL